MKPPCRKRSNAWVLLSTRSSWVPTGKAANSSMTSSAQFLFGAQTMPEANRSLTALTLAILSLPLDGVNSLTGMPICRNSKISGEPAAFASTMQASGSHWS